MIPNGQIGESEISKWLRVIAKNLEQLNKVASTKTTPLTITTTTTIP